MIYHQKSPAIFFSIFILIFLSIVGYLYYTNIYSKRYYIDFSGKQVSVKITTNYGICSNSFPCFDTYELDSSNLGLSGIVLHNNNQVGSLSASETNNLIEKTFSLYKEHKCTPFLSGKKTQNYEIDVDQETYKFGNDAGCKEMQDIITNMVNAPVGVQ